MLRQGEAQPKGAGDQLGVMSPNLGCHPREVTAMGTDLWWEEGLGRGIPVVPQSEGERRGGGLDIWGPPTPLTSSSCLLQATGR